MFFHDPFQRPGLKLIVHDKRDHPSTFFHQYIDVEKTERVFVGVSVKKVERVQDCLNKFPEEFKGSKVHWEDPW